MKAVVVGKFGSPEALVVEELPEPGPGNGQVVVEHAAEAHAAVETRATVGKTLLIP